MRETYGGGASQRPSGPYSTALVFQARRSNPTRMAETPRPSSFLPTIENKLPPPRPAPEGMVWIPGGEFSMGSDGGQRIVVRPAGRDARRAAHPSRVCGWLLDGRDGSDQRAVREIRESHRLRDRCRAEADERGISHRAAGKSRRRFHGLHADAAAGAAEQLFSVVELRARRGLAASRPGRTATSKAARNIPWCKSPTRTPRPTRSGRANVCRPRRSGNSPRAAARRASSMPGATS